MFALSFWRDVLSRAARSAAQVVAPTILLVAVTGSVSGVSWGAVADLAGVAFLVSAGKALANLTPDAGAPVWEQYAFRAVPAAVTAFLGFLTATGFHLVTADWRAIGIACAGAFAASLLHSFIDPAQPAAASLTASQRTALGVLA